VHGRETPDFIAKLEKELKHMNSQFKLPELQF
jgi:hypothetical protein